MPLALRELARSYLNAVMNPVLLRRRQLVLREAGRFPDLARKYHESWLRRTIEVLATVFDRLSERRELLVDDPLLAAMQFAFLVVGEPLDTAMFSWRATPYASRAQFASRRCGRSLRCRL